MPEVAVRVALAVGLLGLLCLLLALQQTVGLGATAWVVGLACGLAVTAAVARGKPGPGGMGPADLVTLTRTLLACGVAALVAQAGVAGGSSGALLTVAVTALGLDAVDGRVARLTGTVSPFGARFDGEADAFLLLVLSVHVAGVLGWWVLAIGAARYVFGLAGWVWPWMSAPLPFRYWRKVVTAVQGIALVVAVADVLPRTASSVAVLVALGLLAESFGRDVIWLCRHSRSTRTRTRSRGAVRRRGADTRVPAR